MSLARDSSLFTDAGNLRTLLVGKQKLDDAKSTLISYKKGEVHEMTAQLWKAKKFVDSAVHPGETASSGSRNDILCKIILTTCEETGEAIILPFGMSSFALSGLFVTAGMLMPGLGVSVYSSRSPQISANKGLRH